MREGWNTSALEPLLELVIDHRGKTPKKLGFANFSDSGVPVVSAIHIKGGRIVWGERERYVPEELFVKWMPTRLRKGDVLLTSEAPLGEVAQIANDDPVVLSQRLFALRGKNKTLDNGYLAYYLRSERGQAELHRRATGTTVLGIRQSELRKITVAYPAFEEQRAIAGVLGALDDLIDTNQRLARDCSYLASDLAYSVDELVPLSVIAVAGRETADPIGLIDHYSIPVFDSTGLPDRVDGSTVKSRKALLSAPAALVSRLNPHIPRVWMAYPEAGIPALASTEFVPLIGHAAPTEFVWAVCASPAFLKQMAQHVTGTTGSHQRVDKDAILHFLVPDPATLGPDKVSTVAALVQCAHSSRIEAFQATRTRDELLPLLMSGVVSVGEVAG